MIFISTIVFALLLLQTLALEVHIQDATKLRIGQVSGPDEYERLSKILSHYGVKLAHGTQANTLLPMIKTTNYEMLNVFDLLKHDSAPMSGELNFGILYDYGHNLKYLDFLPSEGAGFLDYSRSYYASSDQNVLNANSIHIEGNVSVPNINTQTFKDKLNDICDVIMDDSNTDKHNLWIQFSISVIRLKLFDINAFTSDHTLMTKMEKVREICMQFVNRFITELELGIQICDDSHLQPSMDIFRGKSVNDTKEKEASSNISSLFQEKLGINRFSEINDLNFAKCEWLKGHDYHVKGIPYGTNYWLSLSMLSKINKYQHQETLKTFSLLNKMKHARTCYGEKEHEYKEMRLSVSEFTIILKSYPYLLFPDTCGDIKMNRLSHFWKVLLQNTLAFEKERYFVLQKASDPNRIDGIYSLSDSDKEFMTSKDIPMIVGMKTYVPKEDRNNIKFGRVCDEGKYIDVIVVEKDNAAVVKEYIVLELAECAGNLTIITI